MLRIYEDDFCPKVKNTHVETSQVNPPQPFAFLHRRAQRGALG